MYLSAVHVGKTICSYVQCIWGCLYVAMWNVCRSIHMYLCAVHVGISISIYVQFM